MENKLPSREEVGEAVRHGRMIERDAIFYYIAQAYADGKLIEPMSREELYNKLVAIENDEKGLVGIGIKQRIADTLLGRVGKVQEDKFEVTSMDARVWAKEFNRVLVGKGEQPWDEGIMIGWFANSIMAGYDEARRRYDKPHVELTEEDVTKIIKDNMHYYEDPDCHSGLGRVAQEIVKAMRMKINTEDTVFVAGNGDEFKIHGFLKETIFIEGSPLPLKVFKPLFVKVREENGA